MSITYEEALATLSAMFGSVWSQERLDAVLRHHGGHMENTVDTILSHGDKNPQDLIDRLNQSQLGMDLDEQLARELVREDQNNESNDFQTHRLVPTGTSTRNNTSATTQPPALRRTNPPTPVGGKSTQPQNHPSPQVQEKETKKSTTELPPDFLRIPGYNYNNTSGRTLTAMEEDEALARMLQDELFMNELRNDPEFSHLANGRIRSSNISTGISSRRSAPSSAAHPPNGQGHSLFRTGGGNDGPGIMEALSELGDNAKKKLSILAEKFNANIQKLKAPESSGSGGPGGRSGNDEGRGLLRRGDTPEEEISFAGRENTDYEMKSIASSRDGTSTSSGGGKKNG